MQLLAGDKLTYKKLNGLSESAFTTVKFLAYEQLITQKYGIDESADVHLLGLGRLSRLTGGRTAINNITLILVYII